MRAKVAAGLAFLACVVAANVATTYLGLVSIGFGLTVTAGTFAAGLALIARDITQDQGGRLFVLALIVVGAALSAVLSDGRIALASGIAFLISETVDMAVYTPLRERGWTRAVLASNAVGGIVDTVVFLAIAGFGVTASALTGQWLVKMAATLAAIAVMEGARALLRQPQLA